MSEGPGPLRWALLIICFVSLLSPSASAGPGPCSYALGTGSNNQATLTGFRAEWSQTNTGGSCTTQRDLNPGPLSGVTATGVAFFVPALSNPQLNTAQVVLRYNPYTGSDDVVQRALISTVLYADSVTYAQYYGVGLNYNLVVKSTDSSPPVPNLSYMAVYTNYITGLAPSTSIPIATLVTFSVTVGFSFASWVESVGLIGFSATASCARTSVVYNIGLFGKSSLTSFTFDHPGFATAGTYQLCFSADGGINYVLQTGQTVTVAAVSATTVTGGPYPAVPKGDSAAIALSGGGTDPNARLVFAPSTMCNNPAAYFTSVITFTSLNINPTFTVPPGLGITQASWTVVACYSIYGSAYVEQTTGTLKVVVADAQSYSVQQLAPSTFIINAAISMSLTGAIPTSKTTVALSIDDCASSTSGCVASYTSAGPVSFPGGCTFPSPTTLTLCYNVDGTTTYVKQGLVRVTITSDPNAVAIASMTPTVVGVAATPTLSVTGITAASGKWLGFTSTTGDCSSCTSSCEGLVQLTSLSVTMTALATARNTWLVCYSLDNKNTWSVQVTAGVTMQSISAQPTDVTAVTPSVLGQGQTMAITFTGIIGSVSTQVAFANLPGYACGTTFGAVSVPFGQTSASVYIDPAQFTSSTTYTVCVNTGQGYVGQNQVGLTVWTAQAGSILTMSPSYLGTNIINSITLTGDPATANAVIGLSLDCATGTVVSQTPYSTTGPVSVPAIATAGSYQLCYSVRGGAAGSWMRQTTVGAVQVVVAGATDVNSYGPLIMGTQTLPTFSFSLTSGQLTGQSYFAFVAAGGSCTTGPRLAQTYLSSFNVPLASSINTTGYYDLCVTYNNQDWALQTGVSELNVLTATAGMIQSITPTLFQNQEQTEVTITTSIFVPQSRIAFALPGDCGTPALRLAETLYNTANGSVTLGSPLNIGASSYANLSMCLSVDNGATWVEQTNGHIVVVKACDTLVTCDECHQNVFCSWCMSENICGVNLNETLCASATNIYPNDPIGCPVASFPTRISGSTAGYTNISIGGNGKFFSDSRLQCKWDFTLDINYTPLNVLSPTEAWCQSPPAAGFVSAAYLSLDFNGVQFTTSAPSQKVLWIYYDCSLRDSSLCTDCYSASKPECGTCLETNACQASFQCGGTWAGSKCPAVESLVPQQMNFRGLMPLTVNTALLLNSTFTPEFGCSFGVGVIVNASALGDGAVTCEAPPGTAGQLVQVGVVYQGQAYTSNTLPLIYADDPAAIILPPDNTAKVVAPLLGVIGALVLIGALVAFVAYRRREAKRKALMPPPLTPAVMERIVFGDFKALSNTNKVFPHVEPLMHLLLVPNSPVVAAIARACDSSESDQVSRALVYVAEHHHQTVPMMKMLVTQEINEGDSMATLFRTNSFVTKMFKVYSKILGLEFLHDTLGYELNAALAAAMRDQNDADVKDDSNDDVQLTKLVLLTVCQRVFIALTKAEARVPTEFRQLFQHVKTSMEVKFPLIPGQLAALTAGALKDHINDTREALRDIETKLSAGEVTTMQRRLSVYQRSAGPDSNLESQLDATTESVASAAEHMQSMLKACRDMKDGMRPDSEGGKRVLIEHGYTQNAIAVGGFFFLRFVVPAITAPDAYALMRDAPDQNTIKTLILCGKVLQNLSNDKEMGGKEAYMAKMNEFILANRKAMHKFQANLVQEKVSSREYTPIPVPGKQYEEASVYIYDFITTRLKQIVGQLDKSQPGEDDRSAVARMQSVGLLIKVLDTVHGQAGDHAAKPKTADATGAAILESRKSEGVASQRLQTIQLSINNKSGENPFLPAGYDSRRSVASTSTGGPNTAVNPSFDSTSVGGGGGGFGGSVVNGNGGGVEMNSLLGSGVGEPQ